MSAKDWQKQLGAEQSARIRAKSSQAWTEKSLRDKKANLKRRRLTSFPFIEEVKWRGICDDLDSVTVDRNLKLH